MRIDVLARQALRLLVSATGFLALCLGGLAFSVTILPLLFLLCRDPKLRQKRVRAFISTFFLVVINALRAVSVLDIHLQGGPLGGTPDSGGKLLLASHPSYIDIVVLVALVDNATCIVKPSLHESFFFGRVLKAAGYISSSDPVRVLEQSREALSRGETLILFPEGTRTRTAPPFRFRRGAAHLLLAARSAFVPVLITCDPPFLVKGDRWYHMPKTTCRYRIQVLPESSLDGLSYQAGGRTHSDARAVTRLLELFFNEVSHGCY